jgi:hypothetical protein
VTAIEVGLQELIVMASRFSRTTLLLCQVPKLTPLMTTRPPIDPVVAETEVMTGAGFAAELTDTLSKVAVAREP